MRAERRKETDCKSEKLIKREAEGRGKIGEREGVRE